MAPVVSPSLSQHQPQMNKANSCGQADSFFSSIYHQAPQKFLNHSARIIVVEATDFFRCFRMF